MKYTYAMFAMLSTTVMVSAAVMLGGCNTVKGTVNGVGQDLHAVGTAFSPSTPQKKSTTYQTTTHSQKVNANY